MHPLYGALLAQCVPVRVTRGALVTSNTSVFDGVGLAGIKSLDNVFSLT